MAWRGDLQDTTIEQWVNLSFRFASERQWLAEQIFDAGSLPTFDSEMTADRTFKACAGDDRACGAGVCDACPLLGGVTTEDEMFIPLGAYYVEFTE